MTLAADTEQQPDTGRDPPRLGNAASEVHLGRHAGPAGGDVLGARATWRSRSTTRPWSFR